MFRLRPNMLKNVTKQWKQVVQVMFSERYLLFTNMGISMSLSATADVIEQNYEILQNKTAEPQMYELKRSVHMSCSGLAIGCLCHYWYKFLDRRLTGKSVKVVLKKVLVDQIVCSPACILTFFLTISLLEQVSLRTFVAEFKEKSMQLYVAEWIIWPPAQLFNFYYLPTKFRVLYDSCISLGYDIYTSKVKHKKSINSNP